MYFSPDLRRLDIQYSFSFIVLFACLYLSSRSSNECSVSSRFFCNESITEINLDSCNNLPLLVEGSSPGSFQAFHLVLHSIVVESCKALEAQLLAVQKINIVKKTIPKFSGMIKVYVVPYPLTPNLVLSVQFSLS